MEAVEHILTQISNALWGYPMIIILVGTHLFLTFRLRFIQRYMKKAIQISLGRDKEGEGDISQFGALTTSLAATIGTGNIVGVATAIAAGGPGAVLWMWLTGVFGIATKYGEALLSVKYRVTGKDGSMAGGPMYVLERGLKQKWLGVAFAAFTAISAFGIGNMVQSHSIADMVNETFSIAPWITGLIMAALVGVVIIGGIKSIAKVCERLVPFMALFYVLGLAILLVMKIETVPETIALIFDSAFSGHAAVGGFLGVAAREAVRFGIARGLFSNESGLGSAPIVAAAAQTRNPVRQALVSASATFWDTVVMCALTGIVLVNSGEWLTGEAGASLTKAAFESIPVVGPIVLTVGLLTFVFSTILGWSYYGEKSAEYLFGDKAIMYYRYVWVVMVFVGSTLSLEVVWRFSDITNALMVLPNVVALLFLSKVIVRETDRYLWSGKLDDIADSDD